MGNILRNRRHYERDVQYQILVRVEAYDIGNEESRMSVTTEQLGLVSFIN